jgi:nitrite reductase (NADH) small subunit
MSSEHFIGRIAQIPQGEGRTFELAGLRIAVFHTRGGSIYATQAACPHRGGPLADGLTDEETLICPLHDRMYALRSGQGIGTDCAIATYPVRLGGDGGIWLSL